MLATAAAAVPARAIAMRPRLLSFGEVIVLADITGKEKWVRNDITHGVFPAANVLRFEDARLCFNWPDVFTCAAIYGNDHFGDTELRRIAFEKLVLELSRSVLEGINLRRCAVVHANCSTERIDIDTYISINMSKVCEHVSPRVDLYAEGLGRVEESDMVMGGAAVFKDTRISVIHIGKMADRGVPISEIIEDYGVTEGDVEFARLYYRARPPRGRPCVSGERNGRSPAR